MELPSIRVLDEDTAGRIAAGEVIERPVSVIKELVENSLDAGASRIEIDVDGLDLTVADNGCGMGEADARLAFARHATSKIARLEDLAQVGTMGFRGEALPSIAAAARVELLSRPAASDAAVRVVAVGGRIAEEGPAAGAPGTIVRVRELFQGLPVRLKHLKSANFEFGLIQELVGRLSLARPAVCFVLRRAGREVFFAAGGAGLPEAAVTVFGNETARQLIPFAGEGEGVSFQGLAGPPSQARASRRYQALFVNGRWVKNYALSRAIEDAYRNLLLTGKYPLAVLDLHLDPALVDVNVHPAKQDVRLLDEPAVGALVREGVRQALARRSLVPAWQGSPARRGPVYRPRELSFDLPEETNFSREDGQPSFGQTPAPELSAPEPPVVREEESGYCAFPPLTVLAWLAPTYILARGEDGLYIIDQHAAHERVLYEEKMQQALESGPVAQVLAAPLPLELDPAQAAVLAGNLSLLTEMGFSVEPFGGAWLLRAAPVWAGDGFLTDLLDTLLEKGRLQRRELVERLVTVRSCKDAVKSGQRLEQRAMEELLKRLAGTKAPYTCPHGRPTLIRIGERELLTRFKRIT